MEHCTITSSANAGIALQLPGMRILVDAFHDTKIPGFSTMSPELCAAILEHPHFSDPDMVFFTHCHGDHYSPEWGAAAKRRWPRTTLILPQQEFREQLLLCGKEVKFTVNGITFRFLRLIHDGAEYAAIPHYGLLIETAAARILIAGDCEVGNPQLAELLEKQPVDLAILDFPWITLAKGRAFIKENLRPRHLLVHHIPFLEDDLGCFREAAIQSAALFPEADVRLMLESLQQEHFYL